MILNRLTKHREVLIIGLLFLSNLDMIGTYNYRLQSNYSGGTALYMV